MQIHEDIAKYDFALLKLAENISRFDYFQLSEELELSDILTVCGFDISNSLKYHSNKPNSFSKGTIYYDIDTLSGQSGSPVFKAKGNNALCGIHKGYYPQQNLNMATMITV
jgi:V8-like Glu-specific endopeptidase